MVLILILIRTKTEVTISNTCLSPRENGPVVADMARKEDVERQSTLKLRRLG